MSPSPSNQPPTIDVLLSTFNEEGYIGRCLDYTLGQDYPADGLRVILIDGGSSDRTVEICRARAEQDPRLVVIADGRRLNLPAALNVGLEICDADLVAKIDAHGYPDRDFLRRAAAAFEAGGPEVACVGGRPVQEGETIFGRAVAIARTSRFGVGGSEYAGTTTRSFVDTVQCGIYRRRELEAVGRFDPAMNYGEDEELNWRLRSAGHRILLDTGMRFHYVTRPSWRSAYRQYRNYGEARVRVVEAHPDFLKIHHLAPAAFVVGLGLLAGAGLFSRRARWATVGVAASYGTAAACAAHGVSRSIEPRLAPCVAACFGALHLGYGVGTLKGLRALVAGRLSAG